MTLSWKLSKSMRSYFNIKNVKKIKFQKSAPLVRSLIDMNIIFNIACFSAKNNKPLTDVKDLIMLADKFGCEVRNACSNSLR